MIESAGWSCKNTTSVAMKVTCGVPQGSILDLTRFNKIATQGAPQMAVDKEANSLSRVYSYYSKCKTHYC